jgi:phage gpG-like protein
MNLKEFQRDFTQRLENTKQFVKEKYPDIVGVESINHFKESFDNEGFTDESLEKWQDVKRRDPNSPWYGFSLENKNRFSEKRTTDKILTGETGELKESITYTKTSGTVTIRSDKKYAAVHNFGRQAKIFGKKTFTMPKRQFIGKSGILIKKIKDKTYNELIKILKK